MSNCEQKLKCLLDNVASLPREFYYHGSTFKTGNISRNITRHYNKQLANLLIECPNISYSDLPDSIKNITNRPVHAKS